MGARNPRWQRVDCLSDTCNAEMLRLTDRRVPSLVPSGEVLNIDPSANTQVVTHTCDEVLTLGFG
jgi:hypothetical protein